MINQNTIKGRMKSVEDVTIQKIMKKYLKDNPKVVADHVISEINGFQRNKEYQYLLYPLDHMDVPLYNYVFLKSNLTRNEIGKTTFFVNPKGPIQIYINGKKVFENDLLEESDPNSGRYFSVNTELENELVILMKKTTMGMGAIFGGRSAKADPFFVYKNKKEKLEGWEMSRAFKEIPQHFLDKQGKTECIYSSSKEIINEPKISDFFQSTQNKYLYAKSSFFIKKKEEYGFYGLKNTTKCFIDGEPQLKKKSLLDIGEHCIVLSISDSAENLSDFSVKSSSNESIQLTSNFNFKFPWSFLGPIKRNDLYTVSEMFERHCLVEGMSWRLTPNMLIRPFITSHLFGQWNYPLGVTLNGLLNYSLVYKTEDVFEYVYQHLKFCTDYYDWSLMDKKVFGAPTINHSLANIDSLDDCGSMAYTLLRVNKVKKITGCQKLIEDIADYILNQQARLPDGTLYRKESHSQLMVDTIWADDIYMSIPFLCEYYLKTKKENVLYDIKKQFVRYIDLLYIENKKVLSHVYSLKQQRSTNVAWGRGNGWVFLSLALALESLAGTSIFSDLKFLFQKIASGYKNCRGEDLFWHQVLDDDTSYQETSITSIMIFTFAKNLQYGWIEKDTIEQVDLELSWNALIKEMVDIDGNISGVCRGSGYSFDPDYYKNKLLPKLNDTHGIGILLTAGCQLVSNLNNTKNAI
jgi:rhamnogalacturonyl hydrolase YesR